jgi:hypothetical protein
MGDDHSKFVECLKKGATLDRAEDLTGDRSGFVNPANIATLLKWIDPN